MHAAQHPLCRRRARERGAALVTSLLVSMLLLAAGGALVMTTGMSAANAVDATAEAQAYYAAEAGLQASLSVLRRQVASNPAGTPATFRNLVCGTSVNCTNTGGDLTLWLPRTDGVVRLSDNPRTAYAVTVLDASLTQGAVVPAAPYEPRFLLITSTGLGPKGSRKVLEMMVDRFQFIYSAPAALVLRESQDNVNHVTIIPGPGSPNSYSGQDSANPAVTIPAVGVGGTVYMATTDLDIATLAMSTEALTGGVGEVGAGGLPWPEMVSTANNARSFVQGLRQAADSTACPANNHTLSGFTFIDGDCTLGPQNSGSGLLVVTGTLELSGNFNFSGLVFVLGEGRIMRSGGGGGAIRGGVLAANFGNAGNFGPVIFQTDGGGNSGIQYDSVAINNALAQLGPNVLGVLER